jgi:hypothetical protein
MEMMFFSVKHRGYEALRLTFPCGFLSCWGLPWDFVPHIIDLKDAVIEGRNLSVLGALLWK